MGNHNYSSKRIMYLKFLSVVPVLVFFLFQGAMQAQDRQSDIKGSTSLMAQVYGLEVLGVNINYNINHWISINGGIGIGPSFHIGANFYLNRRAEKKTSFYVGGQIGSIREYFIYGGFGDSQLGAYLPIGFEYIAARGFTIQVDVGPNFAKEDWGQVNTIPFWGSIKIGYTFRRKS